MKKIIYIFLLSFKIYSQDLIGEWYVVDYSNADEDEYTGVIWEFTSDNCIWKLEEDNSIIFEFIYTISNITCDDATADSDKHLTLINKEDSFEKFCYVYYGQTVRSDGKITMSINEYDKLEPILLLKK